MRIMGRRLGRRIWIRDGGLLLHHDTMMGLGWAGRWRLAWFLTGYLDVEFGIRNYAFWQ